jgi:ATP-dependent DNA helicase DinG
MKITIQDWKKYFPFENVRPQQEEAINFILNSFINDKKRYVVCQLATGLGKSAIALTVANYMNNEQPLSFGYDFGAYYLTVQKILQQQLVDDFGPGKGPMRNIKSSSNYNCAYYTGQSCGESRRILHTLKKQLAGSDFANCCGQNCPYSIDKQAFLNASISVTNFAYFFGVTGYTKELDPRNLLILDESHNCEHEISAHIEIIFSERFCEDILNIKFPKKFEQENVIEWVKNKYKPALSSHKQGLMSAIESNLATNTSTLGDLPKKYEMLDKHLCKLNRFIKTYTHDNWVMNIQAGKGARGMRKFEFKPVDVSPFGDEALFKFGAHVLLMSATIINYELFCKTVGIDLDNSAFIDIDSPFDIKNKPVHYLPVGKMSMKEIDATLPNMVEVVKDIIELHKEEKGIIHCINFKIVNFIRDNIKNIRLLIQDETNRDMMLKYHIETDEPTILVSPSMGEGVDLKDNLSRFQIFCKVPFPFIGDQRNKKRMQRNDGWYDYTTCKSIVQAAGRSIRNENDYATTYILDTCFDGFYKRNKQMFPKSFRDSLVL